MKKIIILFILLFLNSCLSNKFNNDEIFSIDLNDGNIIKDIGVVTTSMIKKGDLTPYRTPQEVNNFNTAPCTFIDDDNVFVIRNFPEDLPENIMNYIENSVKNNNLKKEIEIYSITDLNEEPLRIELNQMNKKNIIFYSLNYNKDDKTYYVIGLELIEEEYIPCLYKFNDNGNLQSQILMKNFSQLFTNILSLIIKDENIYFLEEKEEHDLITKNLIKYNFLEETTYLIDDNVSVIFENKDEIYYIKNEATSFYDIKNILYKFDINNNKLSVVEIDKNFNILSAGYDNVNKHIYLSDGDNIYIYSIYDDKYVKVMEVYQSRISILQVSGNNMLIGVGHNQISVYTLISEFESIEADNYFDQ